MTHYFRFVFVILAFFCSSLVAQSSSTPTITTTLSLETSLVTSYSISSSGTQNVIASTVFTSIFNVTVTQRPSSSSASATSSSAASASASATPAPVILATKLDPAFGVLGAILVVTGLPMAFWGHKNRWTCFFLSGFYTLSLVCFVLILHFGILPAVNPPSKTLRGMFVLATTVAGFAGGGIAIFFWQASKFFAGAWGGLALAMYIQCFHDGGVIKSIAFRWIFYIVCAVIGFVLCTIPKIHIHVILVSTAMLGATTVMLGIDCYTTAGLKEFYVWNLGFADLYPKFTTRSIQFPVSQTMEIELGLLAAVALMGGAIQFRIVGVLQRKLQEIKADQERNNQDEEAAAGRYVETLHEKEAWEKEHPSLDSRKDSDFSHATSAVATSRPGDETHDSTFTLVGDRAKHFSGGIPTPTGGTKSSGVLPAMDLGAGIGDEVPQSFIAAPRSSSPDAIAMQGMTASQLEEIKRKESLVAEIHTIRRSIDVLKSETSSSHRSRRASTHLDDYNPNASHLRPPRERDPRARVHSMDGLSQAAESIGRSSSVPLQDNNWDSYVRDRKLFQPPSGVSPPLMPSSVPVRAALPPAVAEALSQRKRRESQLGGTNDSSPSRSSDDIPVANLLKMQGKRASNVPYALAPAPAPAPVTILPPRKFSPPLVAPIPRHPDVTRTRTFEELDQRHREKLKALQAPLSRAEKEQAELAASKSRWERAKAMEKEAVTKRQAEQAALLAKSGKRKSAAVELEPSRSTKRVSQVMQDPPRHSRSLSADKLGGGPSSRRLSTMKVEDWKQYQNDVEQGVKTAPRRESRNSAAFPTSDSRRKSGLSRSPAS